MEAWQWGNAQQSIKIAAIHAFRLVQNVLLGLGLVLLALIDCVVVLIYVMPRGALLKPDDWLVMAGLGTVYFMLMAGAMFPGHRR